MKIVIYKYILHYTQVPEIVRLPTGAKIVDFGIQTSTEDIVLWALVDPDAVIEERVFMLAFTGQEVEGVIIEIFGTKIVAKTGIVIHLLELEPASVKPFDPETDDRFK